MSLHPPPTDQRPITGPAELADRWRQVLGSEPYRTRCVWLLFLDPARRPTGPVLTFEDVPDGPYDLAAADLAGTCREILDGPGGGGSVAFLMSRPGGGPWTVSDRAWGRFLDRAAQEVDQKAGGLRWPVRLAHRYDAAEVAAVLTLSPAAGSPPPAPAAGPAR